MRILIVEPGKAPRAAELTGKLKEMQRIVGGYIQAIYPFSEEVALICNDEGKLQGLPLNRGLRDERGELYDIICGTFFLCGAPSDGEDFTSLTPAQLEQFQRRFQTPELFARIRNRIICLPLEEIED